MFSNLQWRSCSSQEIWELWNCTSFPVLPAAAHKQNHIVKNFRQQNTGLMKKSFGAIPIANLGNCTSPHTTSIPIPSPSPTPKKPHLIRIPVILQQSQVPGIPLPHDKSDWTFSFWASPASLLHQHAGWALGPLALRRNWKDATKLYEIICKIYKNAFCWGRRAFIFAISHFR